MVRREFLHLIGLASAGVVSGCNWTNARKNIFPFITSPDKIIPGVADWYASVCPECPAACGILLRSREARPVKIEGNPEHPVNNGKLCARGQAALQGLYNPDRILSPLLKKNNKFEAISWTEAREILVSKLKENMATPESVGIFTSMNNGTSDKLLQAFCSDFSISNRIDFEPINYYYFRKASELTFNKNYIPGINLKESDFVLSFNCDFLETWLSPVNLSLDFSHKRNPENGLNKLVYIGPRLSLTAANSSKWLKAKPGSESLIALGILNYIVNQNKIPVTDKLHNIRSFSANYSPDTVSAKTGISREEIISVAKHLIEAKKPVVLAGEDKPDNEEQLQIVVNLINYVLGGFNNSISYGEDYRNWKFSEPMELTAFISKMKSNQIRLLIINNSNPVYSIPASFGFESALKENKFVINFASYYDDTVEMSDLVLPLRTTLENWGDSESRNGVYNLYQPILEPLHECYGFEDILISSIKDINPNISAKYPVAYYDYLKDSWKEIYQSNKIAGDFESFFHNCIKKGGYWKKQPKENVSLSDKVFSYQVNENIQTGLTLIEYPSIKYYDGRGANRPWLQEMPDPVTTIVWDSWVEVNQATAKKYQLEQNDIALIENGSAKIEMPVYIYNGLVDDVIAIPLGLGHNNFGRYSKNSDANPFNLIALKDNLNLNISNIKLSNTGKKYNLVSVSGSPTDLGREIIQHTGASKNEYEENKEAQIYPPVEHKNYRWGMVIDLNKCTGCGACTIACYAENNIPVVGKEQMQKGREMAWLQVHRYIKQEETEFTLEYIPMLCQHCTSAPCETVCPVYAAYHNEEGLNVQVYNRCVGTRYCSNNCPYKVRRFNWFTYEHPEPLNWQLNPDVTVREKGVMEKCTFCIQRIREAKIKAKNSNIPVKDGDIIPACMQTCPANAIEFGNMLDENSKVSKLAKGGRGYHVLEQLNTQPGVTYLKKINENLIS